LAKALVERLGHDTAVHIPADYYLAPADESLDDAEEKQAMAECVRALDELLGTAVDVEPWQRLSGCGGCVACRAMASTVPSNHVCRKCSGRLFWSVKPAERQSGVGEASRINETKNAEALAAAGVEHTHWPLTYYPEYASVCGPCKRWPSTAPVTRTMTCRCPAALIELSRHSE
jgi:hypothetical protein